jgi:hypothetical protein
MRPTFQFILEAKRDEKVKINISEMRIIFPKKDIMLKKTDLNEVFKQILSSILKVETQ